MPEKQIKCTCDGGRVQNKERALCALDRPGSLGGPIKAGLAEIYPCMWHCHKDTPPLSPSRDERSDIATLRSGLGDNESSRFDGVESLRGTSRTHVS
jgi:hypothetical protein